MKKQLLLLLTVVFGMQSVKPASWYKNCSQGIKDFIAMQDPITLGGLSILGVTGVAKGCSYIKNKISQKLEAWAQQYDEKLVHGAEKNLEYLKSKYKQELIIHNQEKTQAYFIKELSFFLNKNKIRYYSYVYDLEKDKRELENKIYELIERKNKRFQHVYSSAQSSAFSSVIERSSLLLKQLIALYDLIKSEAAYLYLSEVYSQTYVDYYTFINLYDDYSCRVIPSFEYENRLHAAVLASKSDRAQFAYLAFERKLESAISVLEKAINALHQQWIVHAMDTSNYEGHSTLLWNSRRTLDSLQHVHDFIKQSKQYHKEVKKEQKQHQRELELQRQREIERQEQRLRDLTWSIFEQQLYNDRLLRKQERRLREQQRQQESQNSSEVSLTVTVESDGASQKDNSAQEQVEETEEQKKSKETTQETNTSILDDSEKFFETLDLY